MFYNSFLWKYVNTFAIVKQLERKRLWLSRVMLCVFVPMLMLASVHVHKASADASASCYACLHHIHHDGHLSSKTLSIDSCLLCHFLTTPYVTATVVAIVFAATIIIKACRQPNIKVVATSYGAIRLRAPPVCL